MNEIHPRGASIARPSLATPVPQCAKPDSPPASRAGAQVVS